MGFANDSRRSLRAVLVRLHGLVGIGAGALLMVVGLSGALLAFEDELLDAFNPGVRNVAPRAEPALTPAELLAALPPIPAGQALRTLIFSAEPGRSVELHLRSDGQSSLPLYADPYTGALLGSAAGQGFLAWTERLHRFLLLPRAAGRLTSGALASALLLLAFSGLYLRWPGQPMSLRSWLGFKRRLKGRPYWWALHAVGATWALPAWLLLAGTGIYWSFDTVRDTIDTWAGVQRAVPAARQRAAAVLPRPDLAPAWPTFAAAAPAWRTLRLRLPERAGEAFEFQWTAPDAAHQRQRNRISIAADGHLESDLRFADLPPAKRALATIHPLHTGSYFGLAGRLTMALAALALPLLGCAGWILYLQRRRRQRATQVQRRALAADHDAPDADAVLVAWASQSGRAEALALRTATALQAARRRVVLKPLASLAPTELGGYRQALFVVSTFGEGQAPDSARAFLPALARAEATLADLRFAVLALGNRRYSHFCAFGHSVQAALLHAGASALAPLTALCDSQAPATLERWFAGLERCGVDAALLSANATAPETPAWQRWTLVQRRQLNAGSPGAPLFEVALRPAAGAPLPNWAPGALVEVEVSPRASVVDARLSRNDFDPATRVAQAGQLWSLAALPGHSQLPPEGLVAGDLPVLLAARQTRVARRYSVASTPADGALELIVRQHRHGATLGRGSGLLTADCAAGDELSLRLLENPSFSLPADTRPCIFIASGSGLAGVRGLLRERVARRLARNWLIFGERSRAGDTLCADEFDAWTQSGLVDVDRVFSREVGGAYVQDHLRHEGGRLLRWLDDGAVLYVCGSLRGMAAGVDALLVELLGSDGVARLAAQRRYRRDVY